MKLQSIQGFRVEIYAYKVLPAAFLTWAAAAILIMECWLFICFATGLAEGWKHILGITLLTCFTWLTWNKKRKTGIEACACFGNIGFLNRFPIYRNIMLIILLLIDFFLSGQVIQDIYLMVLSLALVMAMSFSIDIMQHIGRRNEA